MRPEYRPVNGGSKTERIYFSNMPSALVEASWKRFREHNKTKQIFSVNPNIEVYTVNEHVFSLYHPNCDGGGDVWMYLIVGKEKAFLIDTAYGLGDISALCSELSGGKELIVANTHLGPDHVYGNFRFDHVFCHEYEVDNIAWKLRIPDCFGYLFNADGSCKWLQFDRNDLPKQVPVSTVYLRDLEEGNIPEHEGVLMIGVPNHYTWKLDEDMEIEMIWTGGHMPGHAMFLDKKDRILFAGDDICQDTIGISGPKPFLHNNKYRNVYTYRENLKELVERLEEIDYVFSGHFLGSIEKEVLPATLDTLNYILENPEGYDYKEFYHTGSGDVVEKMYKRVRGYGDVAYEWDSIYPTGMEEGTIKENG